MDIVGDKWEAFAKRQLELRAAAARKESTLGERVRQMAAETRPAPIRVKLLPKLGGGFLDPAAEARVRDQLAPGAVKIIEKFVQVRMPRKYAIRMPNPGPGAGAASAVAAGDDEGFCNEAWAQELWDNGGVQGADLVLYLTANNTKDCRAGALAYTLPCMTDLVTGRPIAAGINICPLSQRSSPRRLLNTLVHEMVHSLGFSGQLFPLYYDSATWNPYKKSDQVAVEYEPRNQSQPAQMFITFPAMKKLAQEHYGCTSLPGAPADVGSFASHFKQRVMGHELMMPATSEDGATKQITPFTLTLLDSTGWYETRHDLAQPATFGKNAGCSLVTETCSAFMAQNPLQNYYCPKQQQDSDRCTYDYRGIGVCVEGMDDGCLLAGASMLRGATLTCGSSSSWSTMRHQAFYVHHQAFGGAVGSGGARCFAVEGSSKACRLPGAAKKGGVKDVGLKGSAAAQEGEDCLLRDAMCLEARCDARGRVTAVFRFPDGDVAVPCPEGGVIDLPKDLPGRGFTSGRLRCPPGASICPELTCKPACVNGLCVGGRCVCDMEWTGNDCRTSLVPGWT